MGQRFIACDREQSFLMPPDVREWVPEDHFAWFVLDAVAEARCTQLVNPKYTYIVKVAERYLG